MNTILVPTLRFWTKAWLAEVGHPEITPDSVKSWPDGLVLVNDTCRGATARVVAIRRGQRWEYLTDEQLTEMFTEEGDGWNTFDLPHPLMGHIRWDLPNIGPLTPTAI